MKGHKLKRINQATSRSGFVSGCECGRPFRAETVTLIKSQHEIHVESISDIVWIGLEEDELALIEDVAYSFVKSGDPDRDKWQSIIRTIDQVRVGDWVKP